jgi:hypothetical protein
MMSVIMHNNALLPHGFVQTDHKHTITLNDKSSGNNIFKSPHFLFNTATQPLKFNKTGIFEFLRRI